MADNLDEIAAKELLNEAKRGAARASVYGALGWQKCPLKPTNKIFLQNMLLSAISSNRQKVSDHFVEKGVGKRKHDDVESEVGKLKKTVSCEKPSNSHDTPVPSNFHSSQTGNPTNEKKDVKNYVRGKKDSIHHQNRISLTNRKFLTRRAETLKNLKDNLRMHRKYDEVKEF